MIKKIQKFLFEDKRSAIIWLVLRLYVGYSWIVAGFSKISSDAWVGTNAGVAMKGFLTGSLSKTIGEHPDVMGWYAWLIKNIFIPGAPLMSYLVVFGEILVGLGLIIGFQTRKAAFFGAFMNFNFLFSGVVSSNPILLLFEILIITAYKVASHFGINSFIKRNNK